MSVPDFLVVFEYGIEMLHTRWRQQPDGGDHVGHGSRGESSPRKSNEHDIVTVHIVSADEVVNFADVLVQTRPEYSTRKFVNKIAAAYTREVGDYLRSAVGTIPAQDAGDPCHVGWGISPTKSSLVSPP